MPKKITDSEEPKKRRKRITKKEKELVELELQEQNNDKRNEEPIIIQLPINNISEISDNKSWEYNPDISEPTPYIPIDNFASHNDILEESVAEKPVYQNTDSIKCSDNNDTKNDNVNVYSNKNCCFWCCHPIDIKEFGMPIKYDHTYKTYTTFGHFCSLECIAAYNFSSYNGNDKMWEIHSWIQDIAEQIGMSTPIRPAPSRYLLKMFNGTMDIEEFRNSHKNEHKTYIMNMPPMVHIPSQLEVLNTSFITSNKNNITTTNSTDTKVKLTRKKTVVDMNKSLTSKMNLTIKQLN